ncbi:MAG: hypothetical protein AAF830_05310 [Pseudomonadota bacterium]
MRTALFLLVSSVALSLTGCSTTADKQVLTAAYESCKDRDPGDARNRCIEGERQRLSVEQNERNEACLEEIAKQQDRQAMIRGGRAGDPLTTAATGECDGGYVGNRVWGIGP